MLQTGVEAPLFTAKTQNGEPISLDAFRGQTVALYFYPKDDTRGCTKEACSLRDGNKQLEDEGIQVIGVSADSVASHEAFADKHGLPFPLVADPDGDIIDAYDVAGRAGRAKRVTYLIDADGVIQHVFTDVDPNNHTEQILSAR